jgi:hypothetical protein
MFKRRFRLPSPALVVSMLALAVALGGTAYAGADVQRQARQNGEQRHDRNECDECNECDARGDR